MTKADRRQPFILESLVLSRLTSSEIHGGCTVLGQVALDFFCSPPANRHSIITPHPSITAP
jgi:hypothetical protein